MGLYELDDCIKDKNTIYKNHNVFTHLGCSALRIGLGSLFIFGSEKIISNNFNVLIIILLLVIILFGYKFIFNMHNDIHLWKVYQRTVISYLLAMVLLLNKKNTEAGLVIYTDTLLGIQSRHLAYALGKC